MGIFFLGAGFSRPAGLPLGNELFPEIIKYAKNNGLYERDLKSEIKSFVNYYHAVNGITLKEEDVSLEEFMSYIDIGDYLWLLGSETTSISKNIRNFIAAVLYQHELEIQPYDFQLYEQFVENLEPDDWIFTFNYDTILEKALKSKKIPYRLYPRRYKELQDTPLGSNNIVDTNFEEVVLLKMHGSINWFDKNSFNLRKNRWIRYGLDGNPKHIVFDGRIDPNQFSSLASDPYPEDDLLSNVYVLDDLSQYIKEIKYLISEEPVVISPSYSKLINLNYLKDFWNGFAVSGLYDTRCVIIGFSLPSHDEYIRQPLYYFIRNFQEFEDPTAGKKSKLKIVDFKRTNKEIDEFKSNFRFVDKNKTDYYFDGFNENALDFIFSKD